MNTIEMDGSLFAVHTAFKNDTTSFPTNSVPITQHAVHTFDKDYFFSKM